MINIFKVFTIGVMVALTLLSAGISQGQDDQLRTFRGQVQEIDWVGSLLTVMGEDEMTFYVPSGMRIRYGTGTVSLEDVEEGDYVLIKYMDSSTGTPKAVSISVNKTYPEF